MRKLKVRSFKETVVEILRKSARGQVWRIHGHTSFIFLLPSLGICRVNQRVSSVISLQALASQD